MFCYTKRVDWQGDRVDNVKDYLKPLEGHEFLRYEGKKGGVILET